MSTEPTKYTVIYYCEAWTERWNEVHHRAIFEEIACSTKEEVSRALVGAKLRDADEVRIYAGEDLQNAVDDDGAEIFDVEFYQEVETRVAEAKEREEKAAREAREREAAEAARVQQKSIEKFERAQLQKLMAKYGPGGGTP
jgi:RPA family protein